MIYLLFIISGLQICLVPGLIAYGLLFGNWRHKGIVFPLLLAFPLSLLVNYFGITFLIVAGLYSQKMLLGVFVLEILILLVVAARHPAEGRKAMFASDYYLIAKFISDMRSEVRPGIFLAKCVIIGGGFVTVGYLIVQYFGRLGTIFSAWDAVVSWNRWAVVLASGQFPSDFMHYPLLIPANWSISYVMTKTEFQYVAKGMMPLFLVYMGAFSIYLGMRTGRLMFFLMPWALYSLLSNLYWDDGYVDVPVAFFAWYVVGALFLVGSLGKESERFALLRLGGILAGAAAITKQAGLILLVCYPFLAIFFAGLNYRRIKFSLAAEYTFYVLIAIAPIYLFAQYSISEGINSSEISWVTSGVHGDKNMLERITQAIKLAAELCGGILPLSGIGLFWIASLASKESRYIACFLTIPSIAIWATFFSYDARNAALGIPPLLLGAAHGAQILFCRTLRWYEKSGFIFTQRLKVMKAAALITVIFVIGLTFVPVDKSEISRRHMEKQKRIGFDDLDLALYEYNETRGIKGAIGTDYQILGHLPDINRYYKKIYLGIHSEIIANEVIAKISDGTVSYLLMPMAGNKILTNYLKEKISRGEFEWIFRRHGYDFIKVSSN